MNPLGQWVLVSAAVAVMVTVLLSPLLLFLYRRRVVHWMEQGPADAAPAPLQAAADLLAPGWMRVRGVGHARAAQDLCLATLWATGSYPGMRRLLAGHMAGGLACALLLWLCFMSVFSKLAAPGMWLAAFWAFILPVGACAMLLLSASRWQQALLWGALTLCGYVLLGDLGDLALSMVAAFVALPLLLFWVFGLRFWRGVAPMVLVLAFPAALVGTGAALTAAKVLGLESVWLLRIAAYGLGAWLGFRLLQRLQPAYERQAFSDLDLFLDGWWLIYMFVQAAVMMIMGNSMAYLLLLAGWPLMWAVRQTVWRAWPLSQTQGAGRALLLLRVFGDERRMQALHDRLEHRWRHIGPIHMIAGQDLALRNIGLADMVAFLSGRLRQQFVRTEAELALRLAALSTQRDADGRYRVSHFWCHAHTWKPTLRALAGRSQAVLMDLRGFTCEREGCRYELLHLARHMPQLPVLLLVDSPKAYAELQGLLGGHELLDAPWVVADLAAGAVALDEHLIDLLQRPGT